jgi:SAM-dependent methyltransferase
MSNKNQIKKYFFEHPLLWEELSKKRFIVESFFLKKIFNKYGKVRNILDIGCATGSHLNELSILGFTGLGIDLNKKMINFAKENYPALKFEVKDMRKINYKNKFDAIICLCSVFCYNVSNEDILSTLKSFHNSLKKGGILIIETFNPIEFLENKKFERKNEERKGYKKFGLKSISERYIDGIHQHMIEKRDIYRLKDFKKLKSDLTKFRLFFPQEMKYLLETNGFKFQSFYGGYNLNDKNLNKFKLITVSKKKT